MSLLFHSTTYTPGRSQAEITRLLLSAGARRISVEYNPARAASGMSFTLETARGEREFMLPVRADRVRKVMAAQGILIRSRADQHATSVAWRTLLEWLKVQLALIETDQAEAAEIMLPFMLVESAGEAPMSLYEQFRGDRALPAGHA